MQKKDRQDKRKRAMGGSGATCTHIDAADPGVDGGAAGVRTERDRRRKHAEQTQAENHECFSEAGQRTTEARTCR